MFKHKFIHSAVLGILKVVGLWLFDFFAKKKMNLKVIQLVNRN